MRTGDRLDFWTKVAAIAFAALPALYLIGFLAWAFHAASHGLGFLRLDQGRYLVVGTLVGACILASFSIQWYLLPKKGAWYQGPLGFRGRYWAWVFPAWGGTSLILFFAIWLRFIRPDIGPMFSTYLLLTIFPLGFAFPRYFDRFGWQPPRETNEDLVRRDSRRGLVERKIRAGVALFGWIILFVVLFGFLLLPVMSPEIGGGLPRRAWLDIDADMLAPETLVAILPQPQNLSRPYGVVRTVELDVLFSDENSIMVRRADADVRRSALWEISMDSVSVIIWNGTRPQDIPFID